MKELDKTFLMMGIETKGHVRHRDDYNDFVWEIEVHHIGPDDISSRTRLSFDSAEKAFMSMVSNYGETVNELIEEYNR